MTDRLIADTIVLLHFAFILFVVFGGFLVLRWRRIAWAHVPAAVWGVAIEFIGFVCPLTYLENRYRAASADGGYPNSFVEQYIIPLIYPDLLFPGGFPREGFIAIGIFVLVLNLSLYWVVWQRWQAARKTVGSGEG